MKFKRNVLGIGLLIPALLFVTSCDEKKPNVDNTEQNNNNDDTNKGEDDSTNNDDLKDEVASLEVSFYDDKLDATTEGVGTISYDENKLKLNETLQISINFEDKSIEITKIIFNGEELTKPLTSLVLAKKENNLIIHYKKVSIKDDFDCEDIPTLLAKKVNMSEGGVTNEYFYAYGKVSEIHDASKPRIFIKDNENNSIQVYNVLNFSDYPNLAKDDEVVVYGPLKVYDNLIEFFDTNIVAYKASSNPDAGGSDENQDLDGDSSNPYNPKYPGYVADANKFNNVNEFQVTKIYDPKYIGESKSYAGVNKDIFYSNYTPALTYKDALARSEENLMSGDIKTPSHIANYNNVANPMNSNNLPYYNARIRYICSDSSKTNIIGYLINDLDGNDSNDTPIFKCGAYISQDEVSAYLFAFHNVPLNYDADTGNSAEKRIIRDWGKFGRLNNGDFEGTRPYQPIMTNTNIFRYKESDFGHDGDFMFFDKNGNPNRHQIIYNDGHNIERGTCRFVYTGRLENGSTYEDNAERHVFYTWTHYNSFEEYLNYKGGYGVVFGSLCVGNDYNTRNPEFEVRQPTPYQLALFK